MSVRFYLLPRPFFLSISEQKWDTHAHTQMWRVLFPKGNSYQRNEPTDCVYLQKQRIDHTSQLQAPAPDGKGSEGDEETPTLGKGSLTAL